MQSHFEAEIPGSRVILVRVSVQPACWLAVIARPELAAAVYMLTELLVPCGTLSAYSADDSCQERRRASAKH